MAENRGPQFENIDVPRLLALLFIEAEKKGRAWTALCPSGLHVDKHPSWSIREEPGTRRNGKHHCFSCKWGGTAIDLVVHVLGLSPQGANDFVAERAMRVVHPALSVSINIGSPTIKRACTFPPGVWFEPLADWCMLPASYVRKRGITDTQVLRWGLGYAVDGTYAGRVFLPTRSAYGQLLNWTARFCSDTSRTSTVKRYLTASAEHNPDMDAIFGEQHWTGVTPDSTLVTCEGGFNALAVERVCEPGVFVGALSGSHIEAGHAIKLARFKRHIILTDPDAAGDIAASKLIGMLGRHSVVSRLRLNEGEDPNNVDETYLRARLSACLGANAKRQLV